MCSWQDFRIQILTDHFLFLWFFSDFSLFFFSFFLGTDILLPHYFIFSSYQCTIIVNEMNRLAPLVRFWDLVSRFKLVFFQNLMWVNTCFWWPHNEWDIKVVYIPAAHHDAESVWWWQGGVRCRVTHCLWFLVPSSSTSGVTVVDWALKADCLFAYLLQQLGV